MAIGEEASEFGRKLDEWRRINNARSVALPLEMNGAFQTPSTGRGDRLSGADLRGLREKMIQAADESRGDRQ